MQNSPDTVIADESPLEDLYTGLTFQWLFNKRGFGLYAQNTSTGLVDAWANKVIEILEAWPQKRPLFILNDFSGKDCTVTTYAQQKNRELLKMFPGLKSYNAVIVKQNFTMQLTRLFIRALPNNRDVYLTFTRDDAMAWLKRQIEINSEALA